MTDPTVAALDGLIAQLESQLQAAKEAKGNVVIGSITTAERTQALAKALAGGNPSPELLRLLSKATVHKSEDIAPNGAQASPYREATSDPSVDTVPVRNPPSEPPSPPPVNGTAPAAPDHELGRPIEHRGAISYTSTSYDWQQPAWPVSGTPWTGEPQRLPPGLAEAPAPYHPPISYPTSQRPAAEPIHPFATMTPLPLGDWIQVMLGLCGKDLRRMPPDWRWALEPTYHRQGWSDTDGWRLIRSWQRSDESDRAFFHRQRAKPQPQVRRQLKASDFSDPSNRHAQELRRAEAEHPSRWFESRVRHTPDGRLKW
jgi:hypothetical protein